VRQSSSRGTNGAYAEAGFGIPQRTRTPEPWLRRLADDGLSYYYLNKLDGTVSWTLPATSTAASSVDDHYASSSVSASYIAGNHASTTNRIPSELSISHRERSYSTTDRVSNYSDDSDVQPLQRNRAQTSASIMRPTNGVQTNGNMLHTQQTHATVPELTPAEQLAKVLQRALSPNPPESPRELQDHVRESIGAVVDFLQSTSHARRPERTTEVNARVLKVVTTVRNLLYVTATPTGHIPSHLYPRASESRSVSSAQALQTHLKAAHRKVAGTLSKLVLSALAMQYDPALSMGDKPNRMESDAAELERSVVAFVAELHRYQKEHPLKGSPETKRLHGVFSSNNIGSSLPGAGSAGDWKGFGYVSSVQDRRSPRRVLDNEVVSELKSVAGTMDRLLSALLATWRSMDSGMFLQICPILSTDIVPARIQSEGRILIGHLSSILAYVGDVDVAQHVDVDAVRADSLSPQYVQIVERARYLLRALEVSVQALYDDVASLFEAIQAPRVWDQHTQHPGSDTSSQYEFVEGLVLAIRKNLNLAAADLEGLFMLGRDQAEVGSSAYNSTMEWRRSRGSVLYEAGVPVNGDMHFEEEEDVVDIALAFSNKAMRTVTSVDSGSATLYDNSTQQHSETSLDTDRSHSEDPSEPVTPTWPAHENGSQVNTVVEPSERGDELFEDFDDEGRK
jgi:son of sevenless